MYTYLIIDDETLIRQGTIKKLAPLADQVQCIGEAADGREGIEKIGHLHPDIVVLDMQMPVMDGTELLPALSRTYPDIPLIVISGYKNFNYLKHAIDAQAIDYVLKPFNKEAIQKAMNNAIERLASKKKIETRLLSNEADREEAAAKHDLQVLCNLIFGYRTGDTELFSHRLEATRHFHTLFLITVCGTAGLKKLDLPTALRANGMAEIALAVSYAENPHLAFLLLFLPAHPMREPLGFAADFADTLRRWLHQQGEYASLGVSKPHTTLLELHQAYLECSTALDRQPAFAASAGIYRSDIISNPPQLICWPHQEEFLFRIEAGMEEAVGKLSEELFDFYQTVPHATLADIKQHCAQLAGNCRGILNHYLDKTLQSDSVSMQNRVAALFDIDSLRGYYCTFFQNVCRLLSPKSVYAVNDPVQKAKIYVQRNFDKELNLEYLASLLYMNRSYLSHLFKQRTGSNFVDYVNTVRIENACHMLLHSERKLSQIAIACGYDNAKYFFRIFKKKTGLTPVQFQERHRVD